MYAPQSRYTGDGDELPERAVDELFTWIETVTKRTPEYVAAASAGM